VQENNDERQLFICLVSVFSILSIVAEVNRNYLPARLNCDRG